MLRFGRTKVANEEFYGAKKAIKIWDVDGNNIVILKLIKMKNNSKYLTEYLDNVIRASVLILPKMKAVGSFVMLEMGRRLNKNVGQNG